MKSDVKTILETMKTSISISFSISDNYSQHLSVVMTSVLVNNPDSQFVFHVLHRNVSIENQVRIGLISDKYRNCKIVFHYVDDSVFANAPLPSPHISVESYFRLFLPKILAEESRTLYLDVDVLCRSGIRELWNMNLDGFACAAVAETTPDCSFLRTALSIGKVEAPYFNAGVMLFNLDFIRQNLLEDEPFVVLKKWNEKIGYADQDVLNLAYYGKVKFISQRYNFMGKWRNTEVQMPIVIRHFASFSQKPWNCKLMRFTWIPYARYLASSPYYGNLVRFVLIHLRSLLYWKYNKNGISCLDICGVRIWRGKKDRV
jgi:lipopolysaccharide biosynthesis glycosyltransferase